jgi:CHASE3 domain sensor protein
MALLGLGVQLLVAVLVLASAVRVGVDGLHAVATRDAEVSAANLLAGMADQQTGLLTYMKPAQPDSLLLYTNGQNETERSLKSLRAATAGTRDARQEELLEAAVGDWQS